MTCAQALAIAAAAFVLAGEPWTARIDRASIAALADRGEAMTRETLAALQFDAKPAANCRKRGWALI